MVRAEWILWALAWIAARAVLVLAFADVYGYGEEAERACAAKAMIDGLGVPHHELSYRYFEGGAFAISHLEALVFLVLGPTWLATKLVALLFGVAILGVGWKLCDAFGGRTAARAFALLFILAPASVQKLSLLALGSHFHSILFIALVLWFSARIVLEPAKRARSWLALGLAAGFGLFFSYQLVLTLAVVAAVIVLELRRELLRKTTWLFAVGFVAGVSPLLWMVAHVGGEVLDIHGTKLVGSSAAAKADVLRDFVHSVFDGRGALDWIALITLCAAPIFAWIATRASGSRSLRLGARMVLAHAMLFLLVYLAGGFTVGRVYHYFLLSRLTPLWFFAAVVIALGFAAAWNSKQMFARATMAVAVTILALSGAADLLSTKAASAQSGGNWSENFRTLARTRSDLYPEYMRKILPHLEGDRRDKLRVLLRFREQPASGPAARLQTGIAMALYDDPALELPDIRAELDSIAGDNLTAFYRGLGPYLRARFPGNVAARVEFALTLPPEIRDAVIEGIGAHGIG
ncbi:MAG TPA: hypothetical protein VM509_09715, partial [Planctomycetota bacterium]|nr:hypothetical protein [Planctomycetota bacterium]